MHIWCTCECLTQQESLCRWTQNDHHNEEDVTECNNAASVVGLGRTERTCEWDQFVVSFHEIC